MVADEIATHCPYCALQCGMLLHHDRPGPGREGTGEAVHATGPMTVQPRDFPTNRGGLCQKGWTSADLLTHPERLTTPMMRSGRSAPLTPVSWEAALDRIVTEVVATGDRCGAEPWPCSVAGG